MEKQYEQIITLTPVLTRTLSRDVLEYIPKDYLFSSGVGLIPHPYAGQAKHTIHEDGESALVKWVAKRGGGPADWAIYHSLDANFINQRYLDDPAHLDVEIDRIAREGQKLGDLSVVASFIPVTSDALEEYRL